MADGGWLISLSYQYLIANALGLIPLSLLLSIARSQRDAAIISGCILTLYSPPVAYLYDGVYWAPHRVLGGRWGVEDAAFCFHAGAASWLCATWPWRRTLDYSLAAVATRLVVISALATASLACLLAGGFGVLQSFLVVQTASTAVLVALRPSYAKLIPVAAITFGFYYFLLLQLWVFLMPGFMAMWSGSELTRRRLLGVPMEEYLWVLSFCTAFPVTIAYCLNLRLVAAPTRR